MHSRGGSLALLSCCLVSKACYELARPHLYRRVFVRAEENGLKLLKVLRKDRKAEMVRCFDTEHYIDYLKGQYNDRCEPRADRQTLSAETASWLIQSMPLLETLDVHATPIAVEGAFENFTLPPSESDVRLCYPLAC